MLSSAISSLFYEGSVGLNGLSLPIGSTDLDIVLLGQLSRNGFAMGQSCVVDIRAIGAVPTIKITKADGLMFTAQLANDIRCKRNKYATTFDQLFTINTTPIEFKGKIEISKKLTVTMKISDFKLNIDNIDNSTIGTVNAGLFKFLITLTEPVLKTVLNLILGQGIDLSGILKKLGLTFIEFDATLLVPMDGYFLFFVTPIFKLDNLSGLAETFL